MVVGVIALFLIVFVAFVQARGTIITGKLLDASLWGVDCQTFSNLDLVSVRSSSLNLCAGQTHLVDYFSLESSNTTIQCNHSILQGNGGALFVSKTKNAHVTLRDCILQGYDGFYPNTNPIAVRVE